MKGEGVGLVVGIHLAILNLLIPVETWLANILLFNSQWDREAFSAFLTKSQRFQEAETKGIQQPNKHEYRFKTQETSAASPSASGTSPTLHVISSFKWKQERRHNSGHCIIATEDPGSVSCSLCVMTQNGLRRRSLHQDVLLLFKNFPLDIKVRPLDKK